MVFEDIYFKILCEDHLNNATLDIFVRWFIGKLLKCFIWQYDETSFRAFGICFSWLLMFLKLNPIVMVLNRFSGDTAELGIIREGTFMKTKVVLNSRVHLVCDINEFWYQSSLWYCWSDAICFATFFPVFKVPYHMDEGQPSYLIIAGLVFTPLSEPLIEYVVFIIFADFTLFVLSFF